MNKFATTISNFKSQIKTRLARYDPKFILAFLFSIAFWIFLIFASLGVFGDKNITKLDKGANESKGQVSGTKVEEKSGASAESTLLKPSPTATGVPTARPTQNGVVLPNENTAVNLVKNETVQNRDVSALVKLEDFDALVPYTGGRININKGTISFDVVADWGEEERTLLLLNFNGQDSKNLFEILAGGSLIEFVTHDSTGENGKEVNASSFEGNLTGKINIRVFWDFTAEPKIKRIFIDDKLVMEATVENVPTEVNPQILMGKISNLKID